MPTRAKKKDYIFLNHLKYILIGVKIINPIIEKYKTVQKAQPESNFDDKFNSPKK